MSQQTKLERATELAEELDAADDPSDEQWNALLEAMQEAYMFFVKETEGANGEQRVNYTFWVRDGIDFPVINSQTGGVAGFHSQDSDIGADDSQTPSEAFFELIGIGFHEAMCFMPDIYFHSTDNLTLEGDDTDSRSDVSDAERKELRLKERYTTIGTRDETRSEGENTHFDNTVNTVYDDETPSGVEVWTAMKLIQYMTSARAEGISELRPIMIWAKNHTEFGMPAFATEADINQSKNQDDTTTA